MSEEIDVFEELKEMQEAIKSLQDTLTQKMKEREEVEEEYLTKMDSLADEINQIEVNIKVRSAQVEFGLRIAKAVEQKEAKHERECFSELRSAVDADGYVRPGAFEKYEKDRGLQAEDQKEEEKAA